MAPSGADLAATASSLAEPSKAGGVALTEEWFQRVIDQDVEAMGRLAGECLIAVIRGERPASVVLPTRLVIRGSCRAPAPARKLLSKPPNGPSAHLHLTPEGRTSDE